MGTIFNSNIFKGVSIAGKIVKGMAKNGVVFWKAETFHPLTTRIFARASAIGATLPTDQQKFDSYIRSMADIITSNFDVFFRFRGTGDVNFKRINLANPEGALAYFYGGYTLDILGFKGNGVNAYVDTNFNPSLLVSGQKYQLNDACRGVLIVEEGTNSNPAIRNIDGVAQIQTHNSILNTSQTAQRINQNANTNNIEIDFSGIGLKLINRTSSSQVNGISKNIQTFDTSNSISIYNATQLILRRGALYAEGLKVGSYFIGKSIPFSVSQQIRTAENVDMANLGLPQIA